MIHVDHELTGFELRCDLRSLRMSSPLCSRAAWCWWWWWHVWDVGQHEHTRPRTDYTHTHRTVTAQQSVLLTYLLAVLSTKSNKTIGCVVSRCVELERRRITMETAAICCRRTEYVLYGNMWLRLSNQQHDSDNRQTFCQCCIVLGWTHDQMDAVVRSISRELSPMNADCERKMQTAVKIWVKSLRFALTVVNRAAGPIARKTHSIRYDTIPSHVGLMKNKKYI